jgi:hypothetical protein
LVFGVLLIDGFRKSAIQGRLKQAASDVLYLGDLHPQRDRDHWGKRFNFIYKPDPHVRSVTVYSAGRDGVFSTSDDWEYWEGDINKSRVAGEFVGSKLKQVGAGVVDGLKKESPFDSPAIVESEPPRDRRTSCR